MESLNIAKLKTIAKNHHIKGYYKMNKTKLVEVLRDLEDEILEEPIEVNEYKCQHGKRKYFCKECGGKGICEHGKIKECDGKGICRHYRKHCKYCKGASMCEHNIRRDYCDECGGSQLCYHRKQKSFCKECGGSQICVHNKVKSGCAECRGTRRVTHTCVLFLPAPGKKNPKRHHCNPTDDVDAAS